MTLPETIRQAAALMRDEHGPHHPRHEMWSALAEHLDFTASQSDRPWRLDALRSAYKVASAYLTATRDTTPVAGVEEGS